MTRIARTFNRWAVLWSVVALPIGCAYDEIGDEVAVEDVTAAEEALLGDATFDSNTGCSATEKAFIARTMSAARFVAVSDSFYDCIDSTMAAGQSLLRYGTRVTMGPYAEDSDDPFTNSSRTAQLQNVFYAATSTTDVRINCDSQTGKYGHTVMGNWDEDREGAEKVWLSSGWRKFVGEDNQTSTDVDDFYQSARQKAANTIWHEAMHQWGYDHADKSLDVTIPRIVGSCMETLMNRSVGCTKSCASGQRPVMRYASTICDCVDDPRFDVGVIPDVGQACPILSGRANADDLTVYMDDEDSAGDVNSSSSGWIGRQTVTTNTTFRFCRAPGRLFEGLATSTASQKFGLLRLGSVCPGGSFEFSRKFDNEDNNNDNSSVGHIYPHASRVSDGGSYTQLQYCLFLPKGSLGMAGFPSLNMRYGVLGAPNLSGAISNGTIFTDDENTNNSNAFGGAYSGASSFISGGVNTTIRFARVK